MGFVFAELPWLPAAPDDFTARRRALASLDDAAFGAEAARLATCRHAPAQAAALGRAIAARAEQAGRLGALEPLRLVVLSGATTELLVEQFPAAAARHGIALQVLAGGYDQVEQAALQADGLIATTRPDVTLVAVDHQWLRLDRPSLSDPGDLVGAAMERLERVIEGLTRQGGGVPIVCTAPAPPESLFGNLDATQPGAVAAGISAFNELVKARARGWGAPLLDVAALANRIGLDAWFDPVARHSAKTAFAPAFDAAYAEMLGRLLGALHGRSRKALVLDLDNTLWGGVLGEDGMEGLTLGPGDPMGEAFAAIQEFALDLYRRGVFLAVSSKNDDALARAAFADRAGMRLTLDHIAVFRANWDDKPSNLAAIAEALNIGTDALVLLDDNPAERAHVRAAMPEVAVPELPGDPSVFVRHLTAAGYFEAVAFSGEDALRAVGVQAQAQRTEARLCAADLGDYLADLRMELTLSPFDEQGAPRIAQLSSKTNQFNLTGRRYGEAEIVALAADPIAVTLQGRLQDRFSDLGMIALIVARRHGEGADRTLDIEAWLMSCRVLGRGVEDAMFEALLEAARACSARWITGSFTPTPKNTPAAGLLPRLGFRPDPQDGESLRYRLAVAEAAAAPTAIRTRPAP